KSQVLDDAKKSKYQTIELSDLKIISFGDTAIVVGTFDAKHSDKDGKPLQDHERYVDTWRKCLTASGSALRKAIRSCDKSPSYGQPYFLQDIVEKSRFHSLTMQRRTDGASWCKRLLTSTYALNQLGYSTSNHSTSLSRHGKAFDNALSTNMAFRWCIYSG